MRDYNIKILIAFMVIILSFLIYLAHTLDHGLPIFSWQNFQMEKCPVQTLFYEEKDGESYLKATNPTKKYYLLNYIYVTPNGFRRSGFVGVEPQKSNTFHLSKGKFFLITDYRSIKY